MGSRLHFGILKVAKGQQYPFHIQAHGFLNHGMIETIVERYLRNMKSATWQTSCSRYENQGSCFLMLETDHKALLSQQASR
jgi:hypothetical protein